MTQRKEDERNRRARQLLEAVSNVTTTYTGNGTTQTIPHMPGWHTNGGSLVIRKVRPKCLCGARIQPDGTLPCDH